MKRLEMREKLLDDDYPKTQRFEQVCQGIKDQIMRSSQNPLISTLADTDLPYMLERLNILDDSDAKHMIVSGKQQ